MLSRALNSLPAVIDEEFFKTLKSQLDEMWATLTVEEKASGTPSLHFRGPIAVSYTHLPKTPKPRLNKSERHINNDEYVCMQLVF